jgi:magnesium-transporting ATPase (P-type)
MSLDDYEQLKASNNDFEKEADRECLETDLEAIGIFGLQDPLRDTIVDSIAKCRKAGITTIMCTGDNIDTATAISLNAGIINEDELKGEFACMTGKQFRDFVGEIKEIKDNDGKVIEKVVGNLSKFK